ncbi:hypothetical protein PG993_005428 [Apiospora rasikravindrae]|uniref:Uncharacterized protein n=1 Tax=Apiospora rasikravindrae TaxID=990691 RepID=A0ABR1TFK6_9PEZI
MALQQTLTKPFVVEPLKAHTHTHTVIFLHRLPATTDTKALHTKVLSAKRTKDGQSLRLQFPTVRWVFPHAKLHLDPEDGSLIKDGPNSKHWSNLTAEDCAAAGLEQGPEAPYISQLILQEAQQAGGLDQVVLGGQGETALAAHDALYRLRKTMGGYAPASAMHAFVEEQLRFHDGEGEAQPWKLAGYVGMHPDNDQAPRDQREYGLVCSLGGSNQYSGSNNNNSIIHHTPHEFIRGGYTETSAIWDGQRIDDFAAFLASIGVARGKPVDTTTRSKTLSSSVPTPSPSKPVSGPVEGHSNKAETDKQERERERRFHAEQAALEMRAAAAQANIGLHPNKPPIYAGAVPSGRDNEPVNSNGYVNPRRIGIDDDVYDPSEDLDESD